MKEKSILRIKQMSHVILVGLSMTLSINLFIQFSDYPIIQILFGLMATALEGIKIYILVLAKDHFLRFNFKNLLMGSFQFVVYLGLAFISIIASLGFTMVSIEEQSIQYEVRQQISHFRVEQLQSELEDNRNQIRIIQENASNLDFSAVERVAHANEQIREVQAENRNIINQIEELRADEERQIEDTRLTSNEMFVMLGETINWSGRDTMFYMMLMLVFLLEIAIAITTGNIEHTTKSPISGTNSSGLINTITIMNYVDALFSEDSKRLVPDNRIATMLSTTEQDCGEYRKILQKLTYKGKPMIVSRRGGTIANFGKDNMKKIVKFYIDSGKIFS